MPLVAIFFARREDFAHGGTGILPVRTAKMAVPRFGCGSAASGYIIHHRVWSQADGRTSRKAKRKLQNAKVNLLSEHVFDLLGGSTLEGMIFHPHRGVQHFEHSPLLPREPGRSDHVD